MAPGIYELPFLRGRMVKDCVIGEGPLEPQEYECSILRKDLLEFFCSGDKDKKGMAVRSTTMTPLWP